MPLPNTPYSFCSTMLSWNTSPLLGPMSATRMLPECRAVLCSTITPVAPARTWMKMPDPARPGSPTSRNRLWAMLTNRVRPLRVGDPSSSPRMFTPEVARRTTLRVKITSSTTAQGVESSTVRTVSRMAKPFCAAAQLFSNRFPSTSTRRAFFSSNRFLTDHGVPS